MNTENTAITAARPMESIKLDNLLINFTTDFHRIWDTKGSKSKPAAFWRPTPAPDVLPGYFPLGDVAVSGYDNINASRIVAVVCDSGSPSTNETLGKALSRPDDFEEVWKDEGSRANQDGSIWRPIPPEGYVALGLVCSNDHEKPSLNAVRCVRADLVVSASVGSLIWNDLGSHAEQDFSAWSIHPPYAAAGQIYFAPGTFVGYNGHFRPASDLPAYSLRMQIPLQISSPAATPVLTGDAQPSSSGPAIVTHVAKLPWFAITDPDMEAIEQLRNSPSYSMERTDQYFLVGSAHNSSAQSQIIKWTAPRVQHIEQLRSFANITSIEIGSQWPIRAQPASIIFSARLDHSFAHTEITSNQWSNSAAVEVISIAPKNKTVAVYQVQSDYRLLREDGAEVGSGISYTDSNSLHMALYPPETESEGACPKPSTEPSEAIDNAT